jgi:predicted TIM-barrel fold metal-dependent hydrolase
MRTITLEEHFATKSSLDATERFQKGAPSSLTSLEPKLLDLGQGRIAAMDEAGIDCQVLSHTAMGFGLLEKKIATPLARDINDELAAAIRAYPDRLAGFATLDLKDPPAASAELERCVSQLKFCGALVNGTVDDLFLDDKRFLPLFEAAAHLHVPIYLHPAPPPEAVRAVYYSGLPDDLGFLLSIAGWGWHAETGLHTLRLILSGLFDRLPDLQLIIGHMGEGLPYALARSSGMLSAAAPRLRQSVAEYFQTNIHLTTSGYFTQPPFRCACEVVGLDRLMFSVDYPYSPNSRGRAFLNECEKTLSSAQMEKLSHRNADTLLRLK